MGKHKEPTEGTNENLTEESQEKPSSSPLQGQPSISLVQPSSKRNKVQSTHKSIRVIRSIIRSFPIIAPKQCKFPELNFRGNQTTNRVTGTLYGYKKGKMSFSIQQTNKSLPTLVLDLPIQTHVLLKEMNVGMVRIALECEKRDEKEKQGLLDEPMWDMFCNGKKYGYAVRRDADETDLSIMELLKVITMGVGVLPPTEFAYEDDPDDELAYTRANFDHIVGSRDSETLYMVCPEGSNNVLDLSVFFVRI